MRIINLLKTVKKLLTSKYPQSPRLTYSYDCEDLILEKIIPAQNGFYVDIGAHHPIKHSNTYLLHKRGWSGINIDANPLSIDAFDRKRKRDINLNMGISDVEGEFEFYISQNSLLSSFDKSKVSEARLKWGFDFKSTSVKTHRLENVLDKFLGTSGKIDLMNIDVEGLELQILESNNWQKWAPSIVVVELHERYLEDVVSSPLYQFLHKRGYQLVSKTFITLIFEKV